MENSGAETGRGNWRIGARRARFCSGGDACTLPQEPEVSGAFLKYGNAPRRPHWLAEAAVIRETVSATNSMLTGKNTGNFAKLSL